MLWSRPTGITLLHETIYVLAAHVLLSYTAAGLLTQLSLVVALGYCMTLYKTTLTWILVNSAITEIAWFYLMIWVPMALAPCRSVRGTLGADSIQTRHREDGLSTECIERAVPGATSCWFMDAPPSFKVVTPQ